MADRVLDDDFGYGASILELHRERVRDAALLRVVVVLRELRVLDTNDLGAQRIDAWVGGHAVLVVGSRQAAED